MNLIRFAVLLLFSVAPARGGTLSGTVRDSEGAVISNAHIVVHWDSSGSNYLKDNLGIKQDIAATTDASGRFSVELPPGFYDVFVTATAFSPRKAEYIGADQLSSLIFRFQLCSGPYISGNRVPRP
jgi:hypothetical protein